LLFSKGGLFYWRYTPAVFYGNLSSALVTILGGTSVVHEGNIQDRDGAKLLFWPVKNTLSCLQRIWADAGYQGAKLKAWVKQYVQCELEIVKRWESGFKILPHRWIVERTFASLNHSRLLAKEYEKSLESSKAEI
jgi:putative transposase